MFLYKSFCYQSLSEVASSVQSEFVLPFGVIQSVSLFSESSLSISYLHSVNGSVLQDSLIYPVASCEKLGFNNSFSGLTSEDSSFIGSTVAGVLLAAWSIKILKRLL